MEHSRDEPSPPEVQRAASGVEGHDPSGIVLVVNPGLVPEEVASLFRSAWGAEAPDSPPAVEHCLASIGAYDAGRLVGFVKLAPAASLGRSRDRAGDPP